MVLMADERRPSVTREGKRKLSSKMKRLSGLFGRSSLGHLEYAAAPPPRSSCLKPDPELVSLFARKGWRYSDDDEDSVVLRADANVWHIGFGGEDAPRLIDEHRWGQEADDKGTTAGNILDFERGADLMEKFLIEHCPGGVIPRSILIVLPCCLYEGWSE